MWIDRIKEAGDIVVQYDPVHSALPWAGVRFLLQIAVGDFAKYGFVVEGAEYIARAISRYTIFEELYLSRSGKASQELKESIIRLYATILTYLAKAKCYFDENTAKRMLKSALIAPKDFERLDATMKAEEIMVDQYARLVDAEVRDSVVTRLDEISNDQKSRHCRLLALLNSVDGLIFRMGGQLQSFEDRLEAQERIEILRWLSAQPYIEHHEQIFKHALPGSGQWLLRDSTYIDWLQNSTSSLVWLHGKVGSGKSTLVSIVIEDTMRRFTAGLGSPPAYFYCSRNAAEAERSDPATILGSITRQLACLQPGSQLPQPVIDKWKSKGRGFHSNGLSSEESCDLILELIERYPLTTIIIDALDECETEKRQHLLDTFEDILKHATGLIKIFVSSRDDQDIVCTLREYPNLDIVSDRNTADIQSFVKIETERLVSKRWLLRYSNSKDELKILIIDQVSKGADGM